MKFAEDMSDDWMKTLPGYKTELEIHAKLAKKNGTKVRVISKQTTRKVVAKQGCCRYLVDVGDGKGVIVDMTAKHAFEPFNIQSIIARGYWEEYADDNEEDILRLL
jgi:hypothetical protein